MNQIKFHSIGVGLDMAGCPNRCDHCWLGGGPNGHMDFSALEKTAQAFRPFADQFSIDSWYREPDFRADYQALYTEERRLSDTHPAHYELASFWRLCRDEAYAPWLYSVGLRKCQLTLFGGEAMTDRYVGRPGAYREIMHAIDTLLENGIAPRLQIFVNRETLGDLASMEHMCEAMKLESRCAEIGQPLELFCHQGSCIGENEKHYEIWITDSDLSRIPAYIAEHTMRYFQIPELWMAFGRPESEYCADPSTIRRKYVKPETDPFFFVDAQYNVYSNWSTLHPWWKLGNLRSDGVEKVLGTYQNQQYPAAQAACGRTCQELVNLHGNRQSRKLFSPGDYYEYLLNQYCRAVYKASCL